MIIVTCGKNNVIINFFSACVTLQIVNIEELWLCSHIWLHWKPRIFIMLTLASVTGGTNGYRNNNPDSKVHGANMGPIWGQQDPGGPHVGPTNFAIWEHPMPPPVTANLAWWQLSIYELLFIMPWCRWFLFVVSAVRHDRVHMTDTHSYIAIV